MLGGRYQQEKYRPVGYFIDKKFVLIYIALVICNKKGGKWIGKN